MSKKIYLVFTAVPTFILFFALTSLISGLNAGPCAVPTSYATLQAAIDDTNCDTINVAAGTYNEYVTIDRDIVIEGAGSGLTIYDGLDAGRPFTILNAAANVTLRKIGIESGQAINGGAILNHSNLTLDNVYLAFNSSTEDGGAVYSTNDLTMDFSFISGNNAGQDGGAFYFSGISTNPLQLNIADTTFLSNNANSKGGAILSSYANMDLIDTHFDTNSANLGGGINEFCSNITMIGGSAWNHQNASVGGFLFSSCGSDADVTTLWNTTISQNSSTSQGGAIYRLGNLEIHNSHINNNQSQVQGGGIYAINVKIYDSYLKFNYAPDGSALYLAGNPGEAVIENSQLNENLGSSEISSAIKVGAAMSATVRHSEINNNEYMGIYNSGILTVHDTKIMTNTRGILHHVIDNPALVTRSTIANNILPDTLLSWPDGAGIRSLGPLTVHNSVLYANQANEDGGGIASNGPLTMTNVTLSANRANISGGGLWHNNDDSAFLYNLTIFGNQAGWNAVDDGNGGGIFIFSDPTPEIVTVKNNIIAENDDLRSTDGDHPDCSGVVSTVTYSLFGINNGCTIPAGAGNIIGTSGSPELANLNPLADNGGATVIHEPQGGSQVLNGGYCTSIVRDQRGVDRVVGVVGCDIGAFEDGSCPTPLVPSVDISLLYDNAELQWDVNPTVQRLFEVYHSTAPYLMPIPTLVKRTVGNRYLHSNVVGNVGVNHYFSVRSSNACGQYSVRDGVGVFDFAIVPGT